MIRKRDKKKSPKELNREGTEEDNLDLKLTAQEVIKQIQLDMIETRVSDTSVSLLELS